MTNTFRLPEQVPALLDALIPYVAQVSEVQLLDFSTRAHYGPWAKFRFPDVDGLKGYKPGQRFHLILIAIMEDEMPATANAADRKPYKLSQIAGMLCNEREFWAWITDVYGEPCDNKDQAAVWIRQVCNVESRSLLDSDETAGATFRRLMKEYDDYKQAGE